MSETNTPRDDLHDAVRSTVAAHAELQRCEAEAAAARRLYERAAEALIETLSSASDADTPSCRSGAYVWLHGGYRVEVGEAWYDMWPTAAVHVQYDDGETVS